LRHLDSQISVGVDQINEQENLFIVDVFSKTTTDPATSLKAQQFISGCTNASAVLIILMKIIPLFVLPITATRKITRTRTFNIVPDG
jgi:hypothetical protein